MKGSLTKAANFLLIACLLAFALTACGKEPGTALKAPRVKKTIAKISNGATLTATAAKSADQSVVSEQELSQTGAEVDSTLKEIDQAMQELNQIDVNQDNVPNL